ncbi:MAG: CoA-binding protein [Thermoproteota archaeon]|jgi:acetyl coenzyme A synthetase (ADP forming)-like protein|uniref:CoA-binding protein n=1 Tax=Candidatus Methanodesulfokora washburnensis TaxID=2478471 RepID=A0A3R9PFS4_9CREN|nr:CoA-binding protein [Candidatus Methanodesulfokores washburnensis]RSN72212.1 CoA-binding protein [Candidatus Methanodesulfokores washburnensis]RZN63581.1 MAG: CoA-binding protein [Candidatus Methanodesulfokores washburnensis]TDA41208.1 MAG: CoA-binding protein [Candidatus Korarchaeota archaeon]
MEIHPSIKYIFEPESVAVIGASRDPLAWGHVILRNILEGGFKGRIYPVNPKADEILGLKCYPDIRAVPDSVDLAFIAVPANLVPQVMEACVEKGVKAAVIITAGFREVGPEGEELEKKIVEIAERGGIKFVGPNCMGIFVAKKYLTATFGTVRPKPGHIAFISQSGAFGGTALRWATDRGIGFSSMISAGNSASLEVSDYLMYLADDETTKVTIAYIEGVRDGEKFKKALDYYTKKKPLIVMKLGFTSSGGAAAQSHTGSLAGSDQAYNAVFKKYGVIRVYQFDEMFEIAQAFAHLPLPKGDRVGVVSGGGGWCVEASDSIESLGLKLPKLPDYIIEELNKMLPPFWNRRNPIDCVATPYPEVYVKAVDLLMKDDNFDMILLIGFATFGTMTAGMESLIPREEQCARELLDIVRKYEKPIVLANPIGAHEIKPLKILREEGIPIYLTVQEGARVLKAMWDYASYRKRRSSISSSSS